MAELSRTKDYYLKDKFGCVVAKFCREEGEVFSGSLFTCFSWADEKPYEYHFGAHVICKWDGIMHWYFEGQDPEKIDGYYELDNVSIENLFAEISMIMKLARDFYEGFFKHIDNESAADFSAKEYSSELVDYILKDYEIVEEL